MSYHQIEAGGKTPEHKIDVDSYSRRHNTDATPDRLIFSHAFNPSLEGLRGIAISITLFCHIIEGPFILREASGATGVTIFFVLSGFLITGCLIRMQEDSRADVTSRAISFRHLKLFYVDRTVRLAPALLFLVSSMYALYRYQKPEFLIITGYSRLALLYAQNIHSLWPNPTDPGPFGHMWSLACEEQFYLIWALVLPYIINMKLKSRVCLLVSFSTLSYVAKVVTSQYPATFFGMHWHDSLGTNVWKMIMESMLRLIPVSTHLAIRLIPVSTDLANRNLAYVGLLGLLLILVSMTGPQPFDYLSPKYGPGWHDIAAGVQTWTDPLAAICSVLIILGAQDEKGGIWILENRILCFAGKLSYAWYLWQASLLVFSGWRRNYPAIGDTGIAFMAAMFSTFIIGEPITRWYRSKKIKWSGLS